MKIKTSNESYFDYCERTEQMPIQWGIEVWTYLVPQLNNWIETSEFFQKNASYYNDKLVKIGEMLGEDVYICDDGTKSDTVLIEKIIEVLEKRLNKPVDA